MGNGLNRRAPQIGLSLRDVRTAKRAEAQKVQSLYERIGGIGKAADSQTIYNLVSTVGAGNIKGAGKPETDNKTNSASSAGNNHKTGEKEQTGLLEGLFNFFTGAENEVNEILNADVENMTPEEQEEYRKKLENALNGSRETVRQGYAEEYEAAQKSESRAQNSNPFASEEELRAFVEYFGIAA